MLCKHTHKHCAAFVLRSPPKLPRSHQAGHYWHSNYRPPDFCVFKATQVLRSGTSEVNVPWDSRSQCSNCLLKCAPCIHTYVYIHTCIYTHIYTHMYIHTYIYTHVYARMYVRRWLQCALLTQLLYCTYLAC